LFPKIARPWQPLSVLKQILHQHLAAMHYGSIEMAPVGGTPGEVSAFLKAETARWRNVIVSGGIKRQ
jgi:hypothetical protein